MILPLGKRHSSNLLLVHVPGKGNERNIRDALDITVLVARLDLTCS